MRRRGPRRRRTSPCRAAWTAGPSSSITSDAPAPDSSSPRAVEHFDTTSQVDGVIPNTLVEAGEKRHLRADGSGHRPAGNLAGQPIMEDVDLFVVFGQRVCVRYTIAVRIGGD